MNVYDKANELSKAIKESNEFKRYKKACEEVDKNEAHKKMAVDLMNLQYEVSVKQMMGEEIDDNLKQKAETLYNTVSNISVMSEYIQAQMYFGQMMEDINKEISLAAKVEADFLKPENFK